MQKRGELNQLQKLLPEGLVVDAEWLREKGYSTGLRSKYVKGGWLSQPARRVYRRGVGRLTWRQVVVSLQTVLKRRLVVGGRSALELQGYGHYLPKGKMRIVLYGAKRPPAWLWQLPLREKFEYRNSEKGLRVPRFPHALAGGRAAYPEDLAVLPVGESGWPLMVSQPERALLELLDELPARESFAEVDALVEGLSNLRPRLMTRLLQECRSVKVKRLFFFFAERHRHAWLKRIDRKSIDLGTGKRVLVRGGVLDQKYLITVPRDLGELDGVS
jgi:hypothetical protein